MYDPRIVLEPTIFIQGPWMWAGVGLLLLAGFFLSRKRPDWGLAAVVAATPLYQVRGEVLGLPTTFLELTLAAVVLGILVRRPREKPQRTPYDLWVALFVAGSLLAALVSPDPREGLGLWRAFILEPVIFFYAVRTVFARRDARPLLAGAMAAIAVVAAWTFSLVADGRGITYDQRLLGPYQTANYFALLLVPLILMTVCWPRREWLALRLAAAGGGLLMLLLSNSRGGELALLAGALVTIPFLGRRFRLILAAVLIGSLAAAAAVFGPRLIEHSEEQVVSARPVVWREAAGAIAARPLFPVGPGQFQRLFRERVAGNETERLYVAPQAHNAHNFILVAWTEWGLLTVVALLGIVGTTILTIVRRRNYWMIVPSAMLAAIIFHGLVDTSVFKNDLAILFWLTVALTVVLPKVRKRRLG